MPAHLKTMQLHDVQQVLGRALMDPAFRKALTKSPAATLKALGYDADRKVVAFFGNLKAKSFAAAAAEVEKDYDKTAADNVSRPRCA